LADFVFLHGGGQGGWVWDEAIAAMQAQSGSAHRYLALDGPGCGTKRGQDTSGYDFAGITAELVADIEASGMRDVVLVGHSQAGLSMPAMAQLRPDLFARMICVSCAAPEPGLNAVEMAMQRMHREEHPFNDAELSPRERSRALFCSDMPDAQAEAFLDKLGFDQWPSVCYTHNDWTYDHLAALPVSYVLCLEDVIMPLEWQQVFARRLHARSTPRIDCGHQAMNTRPWALAEILLAETAG